MTTSTQAPGGFETSEMHRLLRRACASAGLDASDARLLRGHTNAVVLLEREGVVVKIARRGSRVDDVRRTVAFVRGLTDLAFATVPLLAVEQPVVVDGHAVTFWVYLPQPSHPVSAEQLAEPLRALHALRQPEFALPVRDDIRAIRRSISAITCLPSTSLAFLSEHTDRLETELAGVEFALDPGTIQGDPQHRNALHTPDGRAVLCDWDTVAFGQPEWDLVTVEVHCRRFGHGPRHYSRFADTYGWDVRAWPGYATLADIRELRMITTNARKTHQTPGSLDEVEHRVEGLRSADRHLPWTIL
ncbi:aminoglycoside phosphotransferase family protein (plasmid) [Embleya sp. NBC_00888]|uniref:aminoglycoside phosphotransferase family protein n=1 Tax=Embleya sp. NBC_00888 TaxID=2975960 RepID=UPI002F90D7DF|nr:aminoglycoside phosphotransferase family protein [Embleya sp. NBC_00888]